MTQPPALAQRLLALADDELILAHRHSEWTGHGPILEEDIAFTNIALDELGHASLWYGLVQGLTGDDPDQLVFFRGPEAYRCAQMVELPRGDWAFSMLRQCLFDMTEAVRLPELARSRHEPTAAVAAKIATEEIYHLRHTRAWVERLGLGTEESHRRMQAALDALWPYCGQLFAPLPGEAELAADGLVPEPATVREAWEALARPLLAAAGLSVPAALPATTLSRAEHTPHLGPLLEDMQQVARLEAVGTEW